jgi:hypothetical protein
MAEYRMTKSTETDEELEKLLLPLMDQRDLNTDEFVGAFRAAAPQDDFSELCQYLGEFRRR